MVLVVLTGDLNTRIQYLSVLIDHVEHWITTVKIAKDEDAILGVKRKLNAAFAYLVTMKTLDRKLTEEGETQIREQFRRYGIVLDQSWGTPRAAYGAQCVRELTGINTARKYYVNAVGEYSECLKGSSTGYANATTATAGAMNIILSICYDNDLCDISEKEFMKSATPQPEPVRKV